MRENGTLYWLLTDHLGSTAITAYSGGGKKAEIRYKAWGEDRYTSGTTPTTYRFTGQRWDDTIELYFYKARYYDPALGRFVQPDTIVPNPGNPQALNRYSYVLNNPLRYIDPTGYLTEEQIMAHFRVETWEEVLAFFGAGGELEGRWGWLEVLREVELGDKVQVLEGWSAWSFGTVDDFTIFSGTFVDRDGQLFIQSGRSFVPANTVGQWGNAYYTAHRSSSGGYYGGRQIYVERVYYHLKFDRNRVDWAGAGLDAGGIAADVFTLGAAGRGANAAKIARTARELGIALDVTSVTISWPPVAIGAVTGELSNREVVDFGLDLAGLVFPFVPDVVSLCVNFGGAFYLTP
jgi:RHS repeat-associated protein